MTSDGYFLRVKSTLTTFDPSSTGSAGFVGRLVILGLVMLLDRLGLGIGLEVQPEFDRRVEELR